MADSDLDIRIKVKNEAEGVVDDFNKSLEETKEKVESLSEVSVGGDLAKEFEETAKALEKFAASGDFGKIIDNVTQMAVDAGITADTFGTFFDQVVTEFGVMAAEAAKTGDTVKSELFDAMAKGMQDFASSPEFGALAASFGKIDEAAKKTGEELENTGQKKDKFRKNLKEAENDANTLGGAFGLLQGKIGKIAAGFTLGGLALKAFDFGARKLSEALDFVVKGIGEAAQTQQLDTALKALGASSGQSAVLLNQTVESLEKLGFAGSAARETVIRMTQAELDLSTAQALGEAARTQAIVSGKEQGQVLETLVNAIANGNARSLRSIGITVNKTKAEQDFAAAMGLSADQLTDTEKQAALLQATLEKTSKASGAAKDGAEDYNVILQQLNKESKEASEQLGKAFLPLATAFAKLELAVINFFKAFTASKEVQDLLDRLTRTLEGAATLFNQMSSQKGFDPLVFAGPVGMSMALIKKLVATKKDAGLEILQEEQRVEREREKVREAAIAKEEDAKNKSIALSKAKAEAGIKSLIGFQPLAQFTNLSDAGRKAVDSLTHVFDNFSKQTGENIEASFGKVRQAFFNAFAQQKTSQDFENFLARAQEKALRLGINFKDIQQEGVFRKQKVLLEEMTATMTAFIDASKQLLTIQQTYNNLRQSGVQHELALQQITAEVMNDQAKLNALSLRGAALKIQSAKEEFDATHANTVRTRDEQLRRINEDYLSEKQKAERVFVVQKEFRAKSLKENVDYFNTLKTLQEQYVGTVKQAELEIKRIRDEAVKAARSDQQTLREMERERMTPEAAARDVERERLERLEAVKVAIAAGDIARAKEELVELRKITAEKAKAEGPGDTQARRDAIVQQRELAELTQEVAGAELARAQTTKTTEQQNLAAVTERINAVKTQIDQLAKEMAVDIKIQLNPDSKTKFVADATAALAVTPIPVPLLATDADLTKLKDQVQTFLNQQRFSIPLSVGSGAKPAGGEAAGGLIGGYSPHSKADNLLSWLTAGEYVQPVSAVRHYGTAFMESIRKMQFPRFAEGGVVGGSAASSAEGETTLHLTFQGKSLGRVHGAHDTVRNITKALKDLSRGVA
jgi:hypothetical protein